MSLSKNKINKREFFPQVNSNFNQSSENHYVHLVDEQTNYFLRPISYETIDEAVFNNFNNKFKVGGKLQSLILLDKEAASIRYENYGQYDLLTEYLIPPFFTMWRVGTSPLFRTSPAHKIINYLKPVKKDGGLIYEEYIMPAPRWEVLTYDFKFITNFRERINEIEDQFNEYFKNKRNVITLDTGEKFEIKPKNQDERGSLEKLTRNSNQLQFSYVISYQFDVIGYIRKNENIQKRERPNKIEYSIQENDGKNPEVLTKFITRIVK